MHTSEYLLLLIFKIWASENLFQHERHGHMHSTFKLVFENTFFQPVMLFTRDISEIWLLPWWSAVKNLPANADAGLIPGLKRSPGEGNGNPLQGSCLGNPMDRGDWWPKVHGVSESQTQLSTHTHTHTRTHTHTILNIISSHIKWN